VKNKTFDIKNIKVIQAPLAGISDIVYRNLIRRYKGKCLLSTEMLSSEALKNVPNPKIADFKEEEYPLSFQIVGHKPDLMANAAKLLEERASVIDINAGCPVNKVVKSTDGSGLMRKPELAYEIACAVRESIKVPMSVKFRLGWDKGNKNFIEFGLLMQKAGADFVTLHGRCRSDLYSGFSDWEAIGRLKRELDIPVFANGDIKSVEDVIKCLEISNADGVSIGRGIMGDFTLPYRIEHYFRTGEILPEPALDEKIKMLIEHIKDEVELRGEANGIKFMRKFYGFYISSVKNASKYRQVLVTLETFKEVEKALDEILCLHA